ncbi:MAG: efflux RND transporter periplasmic adaptor subunit [Actinomycetota bacterium]|nr:efflux RND transporter periplasmic adaptor subunit [Actinomycetota bacterium]
MVLPRIGRLLPALIVPALFATACSSEEPSSVRLATVGRDTVVEVVESPATVAARAAVTISAPAPGTVAELSVTNGQVVKAGDELLRIDSPSAQQRLTQARTADAQAAASRVSAPASNLGAAQAGSDAAAAEAFTAARAAAEGLPPEQKQAALASLAAADARYRAAAAQARSSVAAFESGLTSLSAALSSLSSASRVQTRAAVALAEQTVAALTVEAPISGVVSLGSAGGGGGGEDVSGALAGLPPSVRGQAEAALGGSGSGGTSASGPLAEGALVSSGARVVTITDVSALTLAAEVDETDVFLVKRGVEAEVVLDAVPGATYTAKVTAVDVTPTRSAGGGVSYPVRLSLGPGQLADGGPAPTPRPGMSAVATLQVRKAENAMAAPASAVVRGGDREYIFVARGGSVQRRQVTLGAQGDNTVQVVEGVREGERIVVAGADTLRDGEKLPES